MTPLTPHEQIVFDMVKAAAALGETCPTNKQLVERIGFQEMSAASQILREIEDKGYVRVKRSQNRRVVIITETGDRTAMKPTSRVRKVGMRAACGENLGFRSLPVPEPVFRDPCFSCGVPFDRHAESGCRRWRRG